ncbi:MAG: glycogen debranching N-terminal domain-containing protein [Dehalococcoidia bacterium]
MARPRVQSNVSTRQRQLLPARGPVAVDDIREALVIRDGATFFLSDTHGNAPPANQRGFGLYHDDTRHLSAFEFSLRNVQPVLLTSSAELGFSQEQVLTNPNMVGEGGRRIERQTIEMRRVKAVADDVLEETLRVTNFNDFPVTLDLIYRFAADFADIFEVRGYPRPVCGLQDPVTVNERSVHFVYHGLDGDPRKTDVHLSPTPLELTAGHALYRVTLGHHETATFEIEVHFDGKHEREHSLGDQFDKVAAAYTRWFDETTAVETDNQLFNEVMRRCLADIRVLWSHTPEGMGYPAAGTPWFDALFGRDSCIAALQMLPYRPDIARNVLLALAERQGDVEDPSRDEEPGKILHELRGGDMARSGQLPFAPYYGSIDSTPLFLILAREYWRWTGDLGLLRMLSDSFSCALDWMHQYGDPNGEGWLAYEKRSEQGLVNQGWKDSWDSIFHADGVMVTPPIALCEAQGYAYAALGGAAEIFGALGDPSRAGELKREAASLKRRFNRAFWLPDEGFFAVALDGDGVAARSITSNPGQALWTGIVDRRHLAAVAERLLRPDMDSGWGVRTLSSDSTRYNPYGYHVGTVWPHDNSLLVAGLKKGGFESGANHLLTGFFEAAQTFPYFRLPELFGGAARAPHQRPVDYPVACKPQAWAAGSIPIMLSHVLGLCPDATAGVLNIVRPRLPEWLGRVDVRGLTVGDARVNLRFRRSGRGTTWEVTGLEGKLKVIKAGRWPG